MMVVTCESCTKQYKIDETKMRSEQAKLKCKHCDHYIIVRNPNYTQPPEEESEFMASAGVSGRDESSPLQSDSFGNGAVLDREPIASPSMDFSAPDENLMTNKRFSSQRKGLGLKGQLFAYLFAPFFVIFMAAILVSVWQLNSLVSQISGESSAIVSRFAEQSIEANARSVAKQMDIFFKNNPSLVNSRELFQNNPEIKNIALQKVGQTGYTALLDWNNDKLMKTWVHPNEKLVGQDLLRLSKKSLGENFDSFGRIMTGAIGGKESQGYYTWKESNGTLRQKFLVNAPIPNTNYLIASTTYIDEFTQPNQQLISRINKYKDLALLYQTAGVVALLLLIATLVFIYGRNLTNRIKNLSEIVDRISLGELEIEIKSKAKDEIGQLSEAISRMQDSLRLSIERLRRRRKKMN